MPDPAQEFREFLTDAARAVLNIGHISVQDYNRVVGFCNAAHDSVLQCLSHLVHFKAVGEPSLHMFGAAIDWKTILANLLKNPQQLIATIQTVIAIIGTLFPTPTPVVPPAPTPTPTPAAATAPAEQPASASDSAATVAAGGGAEPAAEVGKSETCDNAKSPAASGEATAGEAEKAAPAADGSAAKPSDSASAG